MARIIKFLGYLPFEWENSELGLRLSLARKIAGITLKELANVVGVDKTSLADLERGERKPYQRTIDKIEPFIRDHFS